MKKNITIVTDVSLFRNIFVSLIKFQKVDVGIDFCSNIYELDKNIPLACDLILVDGGMTQTSCLEAIQYIRINKQCTVPIWFFPEIQTEEYALKSLTLGVSRIINKPFDPLKVTKEILFK